MLIILDIDASYVNYFDLLERVRKDNTVKYMLAKLHRNTEITYYWDLRYYLLQVFMFGR